MGIITAHYGVEGGGFYGIPLQDYLPYVVTRTWHTQLGIFWIATAWLAAGLFIAPYICGYEPKFQKLGVDVLFGALLVVVLGSMGGQWMSVMHMLPRRPVVLVRPSGLRVRRSRPRLAGGAVCRLLLWLFLIARSAIPALKRERQQQIADHALSGDDRRHRALLRSRTFLGNAFASDGRRILALVGRASLGRRIF